MKILFVMGDPGQVRFYASVVQLLAQRGHWVHLAFNDPEEGGAEELRERLAKESDNITFEAAPLRRADLWSPAASAIRGALDYARFLHPRFAGAPLLRQRMADRFPPLLRPLGRLPVLHGTPVRWLTGVLEVLERAVPSSRRMEAYIRGIGADAVVVTPLVTPASHQTDILKSAQALGLPTALCVASWDNLTNKGLIRVQPDLVLVWNEQQKAEAVELHGVPPAKVVVTGAQVFDGWFERAPRTAREAFCRTAGLSPEHPFLLYLCSSALITGGREAQFVRDWVRRLRDCGHPALRQAGVLVRPHPDNLQEWEGVSLADLPNTTLWPLHSEYPITEHAQANYFDALYHCAGVVGINTTGMIEAGIVGRPVFTLLAPEFEKTQTGMPHFSYLLNGGLLQVAATFEEHWAHLVEAITEGNTSLHQSRRDAFLQAFVRPGGLGTPATPAVVAAIERLASVPVSARRTPAWVYPFRGLLLGLVTGSYLAGALRTAVHSARKLAQRLQYRPARDSLGRAYELRNGHEPGASRQRLLSLPTLTRASLRATVAKLRRRDGPSVGRALSRRVLGGVLQLPWSRRAATTMLEAARRHGERRALAKAVVQGVRKKEPIILGPWLSEVGYELLYWIPFLTWLVTHYQLDPRRLIVLSRGGTSLWYQHITSNYCDVFDLVTLEEFRERNRLRWQLQGGHQKQVRVDPFDAALIDRVKSSLNLERVGLVHPSFHYGLFQNFWHGKRSMAFLDRYTKYMQWTVPPPDQGIDGLPSDYVAVRFYYNASFPATEQNRTLVSWLVRELTRRTSVVLLNTDILFDEHLEAELEGGSKVYRIGTVVTPSNNLDLQTKVIAGARAFFGTYGGLSYLAPLCKVPSVGFYSDATKFLPIHLEVARHVFSGFPRGSLHAVDIHDADALAGALDTLLDASPSLPTASF